MKDKPSSDFGALEINSVSVTDGKTLGETAHGPVQIQETMEAGRYRLKRLGLLERWKAKGQIKTSEFNAAEQFWKDYNIAFGGENYSTSSMIYVDGGGGVDDVSLGHLRKRAMSRLDLVSDKLNHAALTIVIRVIGEEKPLSRCGFQKDQAKRILLKSLPVLSIVYGYGE